MLNGEADSFVQAGSNMLYNVLNKLGIVPAEYEKQYWYENVCVYMYIYILTPNQIKLNVVKGSTP